ncbi:hypothetical protein FOPG_07290 [Fusarium oxysporum f. sp. conglutinans race 2 54008]|uniref:Uncharacterized protein n=4 Tax=Fusarium oxysporum TaxID=5507 RepID=A0A8H6GUG8_FUSOX|nr:hypothetical protein FOXB_09265 [Fusarium oxysporum f. sp. conglutinans Fo5176]EXA42347.1 hypothetical protein FOVG_07608 [Fusarium oxysporum f. sp. pisi HDV247]EXL78618.1 hypothetical protein FOPG_07290 [Fusarium oxysporum f. sp. conglutinans race 2 54008]KAF6523750.1 hypothetical protein HZS61_012249 [Fusarium oxysporum f. sp. conglutinans]KAI8410271.1 hypothetical protein FOFC_10125 [Fusarium oxysporum]WKT40871.1 hypothetical protein QSH57_005677 [Fusarium oxysporum f. sp. vasinfectum]
MEHTASEYERRRLLIGPVSAQGLDEKMALVTRQIPSPDERNQEHWAQTFFQVAKRDGIKAEIKTIISTDLSKFETRDYSRYFHPGRPTRKPRDIDERKIKKVNDVFDTDNPVKSSPSLFFIGMMASNLAVKVMPGEELTARTLSSKDLFELTIPMTEGEKQQVQQERGPKYYWQRARLIGANATVEAGISNHEYEFATHPKMGMDNRPVVACCSTNALRPLTVIQVVMNASDNGDSTDVISSMTLSRTSRPARGLETMLTLATETGRTATISTDANAFKSSLVYW